MNLPGEPDPAGRTGDEPEPNLADSAAAPARPDNSEGTGQSGRDADGSAYLHPDRSFSGPGFDHSTPPGPPVGTPSTSTDGQQYPGIASHYKAPTPSFAELTNTSPGGQSDPRGHWGPGGSPNTGEQVLYGTASGGHPSYAGQPVSGPYSQPPQVPPQRTHSSGGGSGKFVAGMAVLALLVGGAAGATGGYFAAGSQAVSGPSVLDLPKPAKQASTPAPAGSVEAVAAKVL
ncbi:MAG: hypothetical protein M3443_16880, partial [Actinomycetota bacterium]|nr:hypothetical protein [Actinomycetota bacterium]